MVSCVTFDGGERYSGSKHPTPPKSKTTRVPDMTVGVAIKAKDGIVVACDSLSTFGRGVPILRYTNKVYILEHEDLEFPVAVTGAGATTFVDKFINRAKREVIAIAKKDCGRKLDIVDFSERVAETVMCVLFKEYGIDRTQMFGMNTGDYSVSLIIAGATRSGELKAYFVYSHGLTEAIEDYGTIGSGAAYAELFIRNLIPDPANTKADDAACLSVYAIKGVEIMDPYVGGKTNVYILKIVENKTEKKIEKKLEIKSLQPSKAPKNAKKKMDDVLQQIGGNMRRLIKRGERP